MPDAVSKSFTSIKLHNSPQMKEMRCGRVPDLPRVTKIMWDQDSDPGGLAGALVFFATSFHYLPMTASSFCPGFLKNA